MQQLWPPRLSTGERGSYLVAINHAERDAVIDAPGADVATGDVTDAATLVRAGATRVIRLAD